MTEKKPKDDTEKPDFEALYGEDERNLNRKTQIELGITNVVLAKTLKDGLESEKSIIIKVKGAINPKSLRNGYEIVATSGIIVTDRKGNQHYGDGETVIEYKVPNDELRQIARKDAHAQRGHYPTETDMKHSGEVTLRVVYGDGEKPNEDANDKE